MHRPPINVLGGIGFMSAGVFLFAANDSLGKMLVGLYPVGELMVVRGLVGLAVLLPLLLRSRLPLLVRHEQVPLQLIRFALSPAEASLFFWALITLPLAGVLTYYQAAPIWVVALSALFLGERVGWRRWTAVLVGFCGVLVALHPQVASTTAAPSSGAICALAGSVLYAGYLIATGRLTTIPRLVLTAQQMLATLLYGAIIAAFEGWVWPGARDAALMILLGFGSLAGNLCVNVSLRLGPAVTIVPFQYTMLIWGYILGWLFFGDVPGPAGLAGAALIVGAGLFILLREHRLAQQPH